MATLRPNPYIADVVSVLFYRNKPEKHYLLLDSNDLLTLPCSNILDENWSDTADHVQDHLFGKKFDTKILKINKFWVPNFPRKHVYHVIFSVEIPVNVDAKTKDHYKWLSLADIQAAAQNVKLFSPEILNFVMMKEKPYGEVDLTDEHSLDTTATKNLLTEVSEKEVLLLDTGASAGKYIELLKSAEIEVSDQKCLYTDFIQNCFPYLYMNVYAFMRITTDIMKWEKEDAFSLFRSADLHGRGALSYQDFLLIFAACCRTTGHTGIPAEIRSKYIFRFFDDNSDGLMDFNNFTNLVKHIQIAKKLPTDSVTVSQEAEKCGTSIGINSSISMTLMQFVAAVGDLKLRGTSSLLRFPKSVKEYLFTIGMNQVKPSTYQVGNTSKVYIAATEGEEDKKSLSSLATDCFNISTHTLKIRDSGAYIDIDEVWSQHDWVSPSTSKLMKSTKNKMSIERFNQSSAVNEVINYLKYFSQPSPVDGKLKMSWGPFDMKKLGIAMIILSNNLTAIMELEPRLLEIASPVYVMGDVHGNFNSLMHFEEVLWPLSPTLSPSNLLFLGDYVDRGSNGLEVVAYLFAYKVHNPKKVFLLRGNHEVRDIQKSFSFYKECIEKFGEKLGIDVWTSINNAFDVMPLAARIDQRVFCCHGGIPAPEICPNLSVINDIPVHLPLPHEQSQLSWNLMWNDPIRVSEISEQINAELESRNGFVFNSRRGTGLCFSMEALNSFLAKHDLSHVIRAHEYQVTGISVQFNGRLLTVFSTSDYCGGRNDSACILLAQKKISVIRMASRAAQ